MKNVCNVLSSCTEKRRPIPTILFVRSLFQPPSTRNAQHRASPALVARDVGICSFFWFTSRVSSRSPTARRTTHPSGPRKESGARKTEHPRPAAFAVRCPRAVPTTGGLRPRGKAREGVSARADRPGPSGGAGTREGVPSAAAGAPGERREIKRANSERPCRREAAAHAEPGSNGACPAGGRQEPGPEGTQTAPLIPFPRGSHGNPAPSPPPAVPIPESRLSRAVSPHPVAAGARHPTPGQHSLPQLDHAPCSGRKWKAGAGGGGSPLRAGSSGPRE